VAFLLGTSLVFEIAPEFCIDRRRITGIETVEQLRVELVPGPELLSARVKRSRNPVFPD
jgi:hypothetical protein